MLGMPSIGVTDGVEQTDGLGQTRTVGVVHRPEEVHSHGSDLHVGFNDVGHNRL